MIGENGIEDMSKAKEYFKDICELYPTPDNDDPIVAKQMNHKTLEDVKEITRPVQFKLEKLKDRLLVGTFHLGDNTITLLEPMPKGIG